ncbi:MAG: zinc ribbon domain-containing protein [Methanobrevibacter sp.]|uniref:zinc ribbon domain-containing protein n=1 Tax=Methanobrevibacter sp. TaxID=66852 RepID=UPI0026DFBC36|nr:zinc ribbon domain-containing protein [Methanobrevibacter sp.]MDO5849429.1 zinc ribbon domain-containing protein [Methanobrevibacter sp.]
MVYCPKCGKENVDGARYCRKCGHRFKRQLPKRKYVAAAAVIAGIIIILAIAMGSEDTEAPANVTAPANNTTVPETQNTTSLGGLIFNVPKGYEEYSSNRTKVLGEEDNTVDVYIKYFRKGNDTLRILVGKLESGASMSSGYLDIYLEDSGFEIENRTINSRPGYYFVDDLEPPVWYHFVFMRSGKLVDLSASDEGIMKGLI